VEGEVLDGVQAILMRSSASRAGAATRSRPPIVVTAIDRVQQEPSRPPPEA
jgi:hypothetical protein